MNRQIIVALACTLLTTSVSAQDAAPPADEPVATPAPEWEALFQRTEGWTGGDGAGTVVVGDKVLWLFADSWIGPVVDGKHGPGSTIVRNAIAVHPLPVRGSGKPPKASDVKFSWGPPGTDGKPTAWINAAHDGEWLWPAGGGAFIGFPDRSRIVLFFARLGQRNNAKDDMWNFEGRGTSMVTVQAPAPDPAVWKPALIDMPDSSTGRAGLPTPRCIAWGAGAIVGDSGRATSLHVYGVDATEALNKKALLAWTSVENAEQTQPGWSFRSATGWSESLAEAIPVAENIADELSVSWCAINGRALLVLIYSEPVFGARIFARTAEKPEGPWSDPIPIYTCPEPARDKRLFVYAAKAHPELSKDGELLVTYCVNSHDFWHMAGNADIYRPRFVRVPLSLIEKSLPKPAPAPP